MKKIKLKKKSKFKMWKLILLILLLYLSLNYYYKDISLENSNEKFINNILSVSNSHLVVENEENNIVSEFINSINNVELNEPITIIDKVFAYNEKPLEVQTQNFFYAQNLVVDKPRVYIYSTHNKEAYLGEVEGYDLDPTVTLASILLQEKLNEKGIMTIIEEKDTEAYKKENNLDSPYSATRIFLQQKLKQYGDFDLIIDLHRDGVPKDVSTTTIDGKGYAKIMLVMNKYLPNLDIAYKLDNIIEKNYPTLSRGVYYKYEFKYNQDLNKNAVLIELGANYNTFDEVLNSIDALANSIEELLNEEN